MADRFDKFSEGARRALTLAQQEAQELGQTAIDAEHLLLGVIAEGDGVAARALAEMGVGLPELWAAVVERIARGGAGYGEVGLTPRAKRVIELAVDESRRLNHHYIGTEHLLLGLLQVEDGLAAEVLRALGVSYERAVGQVRAILSAGREMPPELRDAMGQLARLRRQVQELQAQIDAMTREWRGSGGLPVAPDRPPDEPVDLDRFTERARRVLTLAQEEAQRFRHNYIGTEHLLLGLVREGEGLGAQALSSLGVQLPKVRSAVEFIIGRGETLIMGEIGLTPRAKKVLALAVDEAGRLDHQFVGTEHLLLGMVREGEGIAAGVLASLGVSLERVRAEIGRVAPPGPETRIVAAPAQSPSSRDVVPPHHLYLGTLIQVVPINHQQVRANATLVAIALERYDNGFAIGWRVRLTGGQMGHPLWECLAEDDRGSRYRSTSHGGSGDGGTPDDHAWRFANNFSPAIDPSVRSLTVECVPIATPIAANIGLEPWRFTVAIPPLPEG